MSEFMNLMLTLAILLKYLMRVNSVCEPPPKDLSIKKYLKKAERERQQLQKYHLFS